jgi:ABC-2 type transport system permease protein
MPVSTAAIPGQSIFNVNYTHEQLMFRFFAEQLGVVINLAVAGFGLCLGLVLFGFTLVKQQTTTFFSLGLSRTSLFLIRYLAGVVGLIVGVVIPLAISLALNYMALGANPGVFTQFAYVALGLFVLGLVSMSLAAIACLLAGTLGEALALCVALLGCVSVVAWGINALMGHLLVGNAYGELTYSQTATVSAGLLKIGRAHV